jgi:hypothetical protein
MNRPTVCLAGVAALLAATSVAAVFGPTASAAPPVLPLEACNVGNIPFSTPLAFTANSNSVSVNPGVNTGDMMAMVGGQTVNTQLGELDGRKYTLSLLLVDQSGAVVSQSNFVDKQAIVIPLPTFVGPGIASYTVEAEITLPASRAGLGCYSKLALQDPKTGATNPTIATIKVVPLCSANTLRDFNLGGASVIGQPYTHVFNATSVGSGPMNVDITSIGNVALAAPVQVAVGNSVSYTPQTRYTPVQYRTYLGATWAERDCWRESFTYEQAADPAPAAAPPAVGSAVVPTPPVRLSPRTGDEQRPRRTRTSTRS